MANPRIIIADMDSSYILPIQAKFVEEFPVETDLEIITDRVYFEQLFNNGGTEIELHYKNMKPSER